MYNNQYFILGAASSNCFSNALTDFGFLAAEVDFVSRDILLGGVSRTFASDCGVNETVLLVVRGVLDFIAEPFNARLATSNAINHQYVNTLTFIIFINTYIIYNI